MEIDFSRNRHIGEQSIAHLAELLNSFHALKSVDFSFIHANISETVLLDLVAAIKNSQSL